MIVPTNDWAVANHMRIWFCGVALTAFWLCLPGASAAIDYSPSWNFFESIGNQTPVPAGSGFLVYNNVTGELEYRLGENGLWSPPDVGSKSGLLAISAPLPPVPLWRTPDFRVDESFEGNVVAGSNAIRMNFDRYAFWPWTPESPEVLQSHGLSEVPHAYTYGAVLPIGLTQEFLDSDLYAVTYPNVAISLQVVPEATGAALLAIAALFSFVFRHRA
jgi:hypothetical protein